MNKASTQPGWISEQKLLFNLIEEIGIIFLDPNGVVTAWNKGAERITGFKEGDTVGNHFFKYYPNTNKERFQAILEKALQTGTHEQEDWTVKKDGSKFLACISIKGVVDEENIEFGFLITIRDHTLFRKKENSLLQAEERQQLLIHGIQSVKDYAIITLDNLGYITTWNEGAERIKGYAQDEIIGKHFSNFYSKDAVEAGYPDFELERAAEEGKYEDEGWRIKKDGSKFWANVVITSIYNTKGELTGFTKVTRDLTQIKEAEKEIKATEEKYRLLIEKVEDYSIFMLDDKGFVTTWNAGAEKIKGYKAEEIIGKHFSIFYPKKAANQGYPDYELKEAREKGKYEDLGWRVRKDGNIFWANVIITPIYNDKNILIGFSKITRDLSEQKKGERLLRENEERYRLLIESVKDYAILMLDAHGNITTWNTGAEQIKGYKASEVIGKHFSIFYPIEAIEAGYPEYELKKAKQEGRFEDEGWRIRKDGTRFWANIVVTPIKNHENKLIGFTKVTRDLTERKNAELALEKKNRELNLINAELESFIYIASHDLKAPIANIEGLIDAIKSLPTYNDEETKMLLDMVCSSVYKFKKTIYDLTEVTSLQAIPGEDVQGVSFSEVLDEVEYSLRELIVSTGAVIKTDFKQINSIKFSKRNLRSLLFNLISNAVKFRSPDRRPEIIVKTTKEDKEVVLTVTDNGIGLDVSKKNQVFSLFKRLNNQVDGTGVGLYIVKRIVDNVGGRVDVDSKLGEGSTFIIKLPI